MSARRIKSKFGRFWWADDDGFLYRRKKTYKSGWDFMICVNKQCPGTCKIKCNDDDPTHGKVTKGRGHFELCVEENAVAVEDLRAKIMHRAQTENTQNSIIFQQEINRAPIEIRNTLNFKEIERTMQRIHKRTNPGPVKNFEEFESLIIQWKEKYGEINGQNFFLGRFGEGTEETFIAIVTPLIEELQFSEEWHLDGTFKCRPAEPKFAQLFVVMASQHGRAFPLAWALMKTRTTRAYDVVFNALKESITNMSPKVIMSDYEKAIHASVRRNFPDAKHVGCWFHFSQAIERKSKKIGLKHGDQEGCDVTRRLAATALLPHDRIPDAVNLIERTVQSTPTDYLTKATQLIEYFKCEWMAKVTPQSFSVYGQVNRTNNCQETLNRNINRSIRPQGNTWDFWGGLLEISVKEVNYFTHLREGRECSRPKKNKWLLQDENIKKLQQRVLDGNISIAAFLTAASYRICNISRLLLSEAEATYEEEIEEAELARLDAPQAEGDDQGSGEETNYSNYRWQATQITANNFMTITAICQQQLELERSVLTNTAPETCEPAAGTEVACMICSAMKATRLCSPCGHTVFCGQCVPLFVRREVYHSVTSGSGDIVETPLRLPLTCPACRSIIGQITRVFF